MSDTLIQMVAKAMSDALPPRWQRGEAQKEYQLQDCEPLATAALKALEDEGFVVVKGWQPIETAPQDGTPVLLVDMSAEKPEAGFGCFIFDVWSAVDPDGDAVLDPAVYRAIVWPSPTHWRPLPDPLSTAPRTGGVGR